MATTAQLARMQGFWDGGGSHWRAQQHVFVEKPEHAFRPMFVCRTWTSLRVTRTIVASRWWQMGCRCSRAPSLPSTPRSSLHCQGMVQPSASVVQPWSKPDDTKNAPVQSWRRCTVEHGWLSWRAKSAAGGLPNRCVSSPRGRGQVRDEPEEFRDLVKRAWMTRWSSLLACTAARALAFSLLERRCAPGCDGVAPSSSEVVRDHRHALQSRVRCARMVLSFVTLLHPGFPPKKKNDMQSNTNVAVNPFTQTHRHTHTPHPTQTHNKQDDNEGLDNEHAVSSPFWST